jgi:hypothetical protein
MTSVPNASYLPVLVLVLMATTVVEGLLADRRRGGAPTDWSNPLLNLFGVVGGTLLLALYTVVAFIVPAFFVAYVAWKLTFPSIEAMDSLVQAETVLQLAAFFSIAAHFADLVSTYGRTNFGRHFGQFIVVVPTAYYLTIAATWLFASIPGLSGDIERWGAPQTWRLLKLPVLAPGAGLNRLLVILLVLSTTATSYWLRKRGEERSMPADRAVSAT